MAREAGAKRRIDLTFLRNAGDHHKSLAHRIAATLAQHRESTTKRRSRKNQVLVQREVYQCRNGLTEPCIPTPSRRRPWRPWPSEWTFWLAFAEPGISASCPNKRPSPKSSVPNGAKRLLLAKCSPRWPTRSCAIGTAFHPCPTSDQYSPTLKKIPSSTESDGPALERPCPRQMESRGRRVAVLSTCKGTIAVSLSPYNIFTSTRSISSSVGASGSSGVRSASAEPPTNR